MAMTQDEIDRSVALAWEWADQKLRAEANAFNWLLQAQRGEVPSGNAYQPTTGDESCPTSASPAVSVTTDAPSTLSDQPKHVDNTP